MDVYRRGAMDSEVHEISQQHIMLCILGTAGGDLPFSEIVSVRF